MKASSPSPRSRRAAWAWRAGGVMLPLGVARDLRADHARRIGIVPRAVDLPIARRQRSTSSAQVLGQSCGQTERTIVEGHALSSRRSADSEPVFLTGAMSAQPIGFDLAARNPGSDRLSTEAGPGVQRRLAGGMAVAGWPAKRLGRALGLGVAWRSRCPAGAGLRSTSRPGPSSICSRPPSSSSSSTRP